MVVLVCAHKLSLLSTCCMFERAYKALHTSFDSNYSWPGSGALSKIVADSDLTQQAAIKCPTISLVTVMVNNATDLCFLCCRLLF